MKKETFSGLTKELNNDLSTLKEAFHWLTDRQIMAAIGYARTYPDEIKKLTVVS